MPVRVRSAAVAVPPAPAPITAHLFILALHLRVAHQAGQRLLNLINAILDVNRLESGQMPLEREPIRLDIIAAGRATRNVKVYFNLGSR